MPNSSIMSLIPTLKETMETEKKREFTMRTKEKAQSNGIIEGCKSAMLIIEKHQNSKKKVIESINSKMRESVYNLMRAEEDYIENNTERSRLRIYYHESMIDNMKRTRETIEKDY